MKEYRINEIFYSLQGEGRNTGQAAVFIRFSGCNLHCSFCDTDFTQYTMMTPDDIVQPPSHHPSPQEWHFGASSQVVSLRCKPTMSSSPFFISLAIV